MRFRCLVVLLFLSLIQPQVAARADENTGVQGESTSQGKSGRLTRRIRPGDSSGKNKRIIRGHCTILASPSNPITTSCSNTVLILNDEKGNELLRTRTTAKGEFEFAAEENGKYRIGSGSKYYDLLAPSRVLRGGDSVEVNLREN